MMRATLIIPACETLHAGGTTPAPGTVPARRMGQAAGVAVAAALLFAGTLDAQVRTVGISRQLRSIEAHDVRLDYAAGKLEVRSGGDSLLYSMQLTYDASHMVPRHAYDQERRSLVLGTRGLEGRGSRFRSGTGDGSATVELARGVPFALSVNAGAVQSVLELGGLSLTRLVVNTGASETRVRFGSPNAVAMELLELNAGAASMIVHQLANANARTIRIKAAAGMVDLDFGGEWTGDIDAEVEMALGALTLRVPPQVGIRVESTRTLASIEASGLVRDGNSYVSANWGEAEHKLVLRARTTLGKLTLRRDAH